METITVNRNELKELIKESLREVLLSENFNISREDIPEVSQEEMDDIIKTHGKQPNAKNYKEMVDWLKDESNS